MGLENYEPDQIEIVVGKGAKKASFHVRAVNVEDLTSVVSCNIAQVRQAFELWGATKASLFDINAVENFVVLMAVDTPNLLADIISTVADDRAQIAKYRRLPLPVQIEAIGAIMKLTFEEAGGLKNLWTTWAPQLSHVLKSGTENPALNAMLDALSPKTS